MIMTRTTSMSDHDLKKQQLNILSIAEGFFQSSVLFALLKLNIFNLIGENGKTLDYLATNLGTSPETLGRLLNAGVVLNLLNSSDGVVYTLTPASKELLLSTTEEQFLGNWILNLDYFRYALSMLDEAVLKSGPVVDPTTHLGRDTRQTREYIFLRCTIMHRFAAKNCQSILIRARVKNY